MWVIVLKNPIIHRLKPRPPTLNLVISSQILVCMQICAHSHPQSLLGAWARGPGGSGDTGFEVLDFRTSGHFWFKSNLEGCLFKALNQLNFQSLTLRQEQVNTIRNVVENQKSAEVLKFQLSWNYNWVFSVIFCDTWSYKKRFYQKGEKRWSLVILDNEGTASAPVARDHFLGDIWVSREIKSHGKRQIQVESFSE